MGAEVDVFELGGSGTLVVSDSNFARDVTFTIYGEATIPGFCASFNGGCDGMAQELEDFFEGGVDATCEEQDNGGGGGPPTPADCDCVIDGSYNEASSGSYSVDDGLAVVDGTGAEYYFCEDESSNSLTLRRADGDEDMSAVELYAGN